MMRILGLPMVSIVIIKAPILPQGSMYPNCRGLGSEGFAYSLHCSSCFGLTDYILRTLKGNPKKELQWRVLVCTGRAAFISDSS